jgi:hypothetical protein
MHSLRCVLSARHRHVESFSGSSAALKASDAPYSASFPLLPAHLTPNGAPTILLPNIDRGTAHLGGTVSTGRGAILARAEIHPPLNCLERRCTSAPRRRVPSDRRSRVMPPHCFICSWSWPGPRGGAGGISGWRGICRCAGTSRGRKVGGRLRLPPIGRHGRRAIFSCTTGEG